VKHDEMNCKRLILEYLADYEDGSMPETAGRTLKMLKPREVPKNLAEAVWNFVRERCPKKS
jgi:hypothetical protein